MECANRNIPEECNWDEVRSSRSKGGYPWTHLYKEPLEEDLDPEPFTMEGLAKAKSTSTVGKSDIEIFDVTDFEIDSAIEPDEKMDTNQVVTEADDHSINKNIGTVIIEECESGEQGQQKPGTVMDSAESLDNISQYLDKEERGPISKTTTDKETSTPTDETDTKENERKRKLSAESSYSKLSQTKSALMKKFNDTKKKIKIPKLTFNATKLRKSVPKKAKGSPTESKKETKKKLSKDQSNKKDVKPIYIHIPLKPPPGQTDEFSYLEFGGEPKKHDEDEKGQDSKGEDEPQAEEIFKKVGKPKRFGGFKSLVKQIQENKLEEISEKENGATEETKTITLKKSPKCQPIQDDQKQNDDQSNQMETEKEDIAKTEFSVKTKPPSFTIGSEENINEVEESKESVTAEEKTPESESSEPKQDVFEHLFHASKSKKLKEIDESPPGKQARSKSAEPERKRKDSLESSYSRKSLSKLSLLKKLKEASEKIKSKFSRSSSKQQVHEDEMEEPVKVKKTTKKKRSSKDQQPVYIHIPLKPPEGETDEFSHLSNNEKQQSMESEISSTPDSISKSGVQFIMVTAPSDDEILDYNSSDVPETPSSENKVFFANKVTELKQLAKLAVDEVASPGQKSKLDSVEEESNGDKVEDDEAKEETFTKIDAKQNDDHLTEIGVEKHNPKEGDDVEERDVTTIKDSSKEATTKMMVDVEDGLSETTFVKQNNESITREEDIQDNIDEISSNLKSSFKGYESPVVKKKVSFKRRSKNSREDGYEVVQPPEQANKTVQPHERPKVVAVQEKQPLAVENEKLPRHEPHVTFAEEQKEWSDIIDHEYEPVNPPLDGISRIPEVNPTIYITDTDYDTSILPLGTVSIEPIVQSKDKKSQNDYLRETEDQSNTSDDSVTATETARQSSQKNEPETSNFQAKLKRQSENLKAKFQNIKKPKFSKPEFKKPEFKKLDFKKFKIEKPKFNLPKIPDTAKITLPSFSLGRKHNEKRTLNDRQLSTEANDGDSKKPIFDFSTYPRIFKKKQKTPKEKSGDVDVEEIPAFATAPRTKKNGKKKDKWGGFVSMRIPLHSKDSMDQVEQDDSSFKEDLNDQEQDQDSYLADEETSKKPLDPSHIRYEEDIDIDDEFDNENNEIDRERDFVDRWNKGMFNQNVNEMEYFENFKNSNYKVTDLDSPDDKPTTEFEEANNDDNNRYSEFEQANNQNNNRYSDFGTINNGNNTRYSSGSSLGHRRGVLEEIDSDEFIWRPKGISQEHINMFVSPEMREAYQPPINTLLQMEKIQDTNENLSDSRQSLPEENNKRKPMRKPKRVKTPPTSNERIAQSEELTDDLDDLPPFRPRRRSRRKKQRNQNDIIPYRETIPVEDDDIPMIDDRLNDHRESLGILGDDEQDEESILSDNLEARLQEEICDSQRYRQFQYADDDEPEIIVNFDKKNAPPIPPRKPKSIKSLNLSENDSIFEDFAYNRAVSEDLSIGQNDNEIKAIRTESKIIIPIQQDLPPKKPARTRSQTSSQSNLIPPSPEDNTSFSGSGYPEPCIEPMCVQDVRDPMGYAVIDKSKIRDPPLPPPRLPPRQKRSNKLNEETKFFTVPRSTDQSVPVRPLRNYSTLGQIMKSSDQQNTYENKENIDITQYIEIDDEPNRNLQSGEVLKKMKDRPLPAPPRPPRKSRPLKDITSLENIPQSSQQSGKLNLEETEVSTQTEPLPDDFICEELVQEPTDKIMTPSLTKDNTLDEDRRVVERRLITPTTYTYEETITHGSILVEPLNGAKILPDSELQNTTKERVVPISQLSDDETSSIPEDFKKLSDSHQEQPSQHQTVNIQPVIPEVIKTQKLQVTDLDVETLNVNKLVADRIICSDIESDKIQANDITSKNAAFKIGDISLPPGVIEEIIKSLSSREQPQELKLSSSEKVDEKKTPITEDTTDENCKLPEKEIPTNDTINNSPEIGASNEHLEKLYIIDENKADDVREQSSNSEEIPELCLLSTSEIDDRLHSSTESLKKDYPETKEESPPIPPPRANSEHAHSRLIKQTNEAAISPPQDIILEPEVDDEPPPRPPEPQLEYIPSQPPASFYALKAQKYVDENIPVAPRRKRHTRSRARSKSSSEDSSTTRVSRRFPRRYSEVPLSQLSGQLIRACGNEINQSLKRLITYFTNNVLGNVDGTQDLNVMILIVLVLIAGLVLLGYGNEKTVVHLHHWEYFNPPRDL